MEQLRKNWVIIIFIGSLIATWTLFSTRLTQAENDIDNLSTVVSQINQINIDLAVIKSDIGYVKQSHENLDKTLLELKKK